MTFILKTTERGSIASPVAADNEHSLYADIVSVHFRREEGGAATAHVWMREPVKTAEVPGFVEVEKFISFTGSAYVMNEAGKTVSSFTARHLEGWASPSSWRVAHRLSCSADTPFGAGLRVRLATTPHRQPNRAAATAAS